LVSGFVILNKVLYIKKKLDSTSLRSSSWF
jgi:hypothetical protein